MIAGKPRGARDSASPQRIDLARLSRLFATVITALWREQPRSYRLASVGAAILLALGRSLGFLIALSLGWMVDQLHLDAATAIVLGLMALYATSMIFSTTFDNLAAVAFGLAETWGVKLLSGRVFERLHRVPMRFHLDQRTGGLAKAYDRGVAGMVRLSNLLLFSILPVVFQLFFALLIIAGRFSWLYLPLVALICLLVGWLTFQLNAWRRRIVRRALKNEDQVSETAVDSLMQVEAVKIYNRQEEELARLDTLFEVERRTSFRSRMVAELISAVLVLIQGLALALLGTLAILEIRGVLPGDMSPGDLVAFIGIVNQLFLPIRRLGNAYRMASTAEQDTERFLEFLELETEADVGGPPLTLEEGSPAVSVQGLGFAFEGRAPLFEGLDLSIASGEWVALVGATGSGKSSLLRLLLRLSEPDAGRIALWGRDIRDLPLSQLRERVALTPQSLGIFAETLAFNLRFAKPDATPADLRDALKAADLDRLVAQLPEGLETRVGEGGQKLSGGERQRLALARAFLRETAALHLFDEATSALDTATEARVMAALRARLKGKTLVTIAHRLSSVQQADRILVMAEGRLVETGSHAELLSLGGTYAALHAASQAELD